MENVALILWEFWLFGLKQARACLFGGLLLTAVLATGLFYPAGAVLPRYDFLFLFAVSIQAGLIVLKLETVEEAAVIALFHVVGTVMELYKTHAGSWTYPEASYLRIGLVPLFSGFMYSAVGSYIARASRLFGFRYSHYPRMRWTLGLAALIYLNFFTHDVLLPDFRIGLFTVIAWMFRRTWIYFTIDTQARCMPLLLGWFLVAFFIWLAENIGSFSRIWIYPHQAHGFAMVSVGKLGSWYLLMIVSFVLVSLARRPKAQPSREFTAGSAAQAS